jgi:hypothetical protein
MVVHGQKQPLKAIHPGLVCPYSFFFSYPPFEVTIRGLNNVVVSFITK